MEKEDNIKCYNTPFYQTNHAVINKPKVTDSMRKDMKKFLSKF